MSTIVTRSGKGSPLTNNEVDANFTNLNTDKVQVTGTPTSGQAITWSGTAWVPSTITSGVSSVASADGSVVVTTVSGAVDLSVGIAGSTGTLIAQVRNQTGSTLTKGTLVYITGGSGNKAIVSKAQANAESTSAGTFGMVQADIATNNNGYVVIVGPVSGLNTSAYTEGTVLYLDPTTAGAYTSTKPSAPNHMVYIGTVIYSHATQGTIEVRIQNGYELEELHNVAITTATQGDVLIRNGTTNVWENKAQSNLVAGNVSGTVAVANGGTGSTTAQGAINTLSGAVTSGSYLRGNGTNVVMSAIQAADVPTLNQNTTGTAANITATSNSTLTTLSALSLPYSQLSGTVPTWNQNTTGTAANITATSNATLTTLSALSLPYSQLSGTVPTWNQNTTGTAANITATSNSTLTTLSALSLPYSQLSGTVPTWNQNTTGTASNVTGVVAAANGGTGVNNGSNTLTLAGSVTHAGAFTRTITATANTTVTLPTSGTLISSVTALSGAVTGTPSATTYLRGDGTWAAVSSGGGSAPDYLLMGYMGTFSGKTQSGMNTPALGIL
jgi:hypothetical protein